MGGGSVVSVDPGVYVAGVALWSEDGELLLAVLADGRKRSEPIESVVAGSVVSAVAGISEVVIEKPQIYRAKHLKGDPNDLVDLAIAAGRIAAGFSTATARFRASTTFYRPAEWKGQTPKEVTKERVLKKLTDVERDRIELPARSLQHNVFDAIGIGLYHLRKVRA